MWADNARERAAGRSNGEKIASGAAVAIAVAALVTAAILWDIPVLPVWATAANTSAGRSLNPLHAADHGGPGATGGSRA